MEMAKIWDMLGSSTLLISILGNARIAKLHDTLYLSYYSCNYCANVGINATSWDLINYATTQSRLYSCSQPNY